jgi:Cys-rich repeat protein
LHVRRAGSLTIHADAASGACVGTLFGQSLLTDLIGFGFVPNDLATLPAAAQIGQACLASTQRDPGSVDISFAGPRFGARRQAYEIASRGGESLSCSRTSAACQADSDCPSGETCEGAYKFRFRIERVDDDENEHEEGARAQVASMIRTTVSP